MNLTNHAEASAREGVVVTTPHDWMRVTSDSGTRVAFAAQRCELFRNGCGDECPQDHRSGWYVISANRVHPEAGRWYLTDSPEAAVHQYLEWIQS